MSSFDIINLTFYFNFFNTKYIFPHNYGTGCKSKKNLDLSPAHSECKEIYFKLMLKKYIKKSKF